MKAQKTLSEKRGADHFGNGPARPARAACRHPRVWGFVLSGHRLVPEGIGHEPLLALLSDAGPHLTWSVVVVGNRVENCVPASDVLSLSLLTQPVRQVEWQAGADQPTGALGAPGAGTGRASNDPTLAASSVACRI